MAIPWYAAIPLIGLSGVFGEDASPRGVLMLRRPLGGGVAMSGSVGLAARKRRPSFRPGEDVGRSGRCSVGYRSRPSPATAEVASTPSIATQASAIGPQPGRRGRRPNRAGSVGCPHARQQRWCRVSSQCGVGVGYENFLWRRVSRTCCPIPAKSALNRRMQTWVSQRSVPLLSLIRAEL